MYMLYLRIEELSLQHVLYAADREHVHVVLGLPFYTSPIGHTIRHHFDDIEELTPHY